MTRNIVKCQLTGPNDVSSEVLHNSNNEVNVSLTVHGIVTLTVHDIVTLTVRDIVTSFKSM